MSNTSKTTTYLLTTLAAAWVGWVMVQYLGYHPQLRSLVGGHPYQTTIFSLLGLMAVAGGWSFWRLRSAKAMKVPIRGGILLLVGIAFATVAFLSFRLVTGMQFTTHGSAVGYFLAFTVLYVLMLLVLSFSSIALGKLLLRPLKYEEGNHLLALAVGISGWGFLATVLGLIGLLQLFILWPLALVVVFLERKAVWTVVKDWLFIRHSWQPHHWWEIPVAILGLTAIGVYWVGGLKPYAVGFDGAALYANLAHLTADYGSLPGAEQAYAWSVVMAMGEVMFQDVKLSLLLSHFMFLPALALAYQIARKWMNPGSALLITVTLVSMPFIGFHAMADEKVDLGLLTISLAAWLVFLHWQGRDAKHQGLQWKKILDRPHWYGLLLLGWLVGFCFSIKYTSLFLVFGFLTVFAYRYAGARLFWAMVSLMLSALFISGFYRWGNLPIAPFPAKMMGIAPLLLGVGLAWQALRKAKQPLRPLLTTIMVFVVGFAIAFAPWAAKHWQENNFRLGVSTLLFGQPEEPALEVPADLLSFNFNHAPTHQAPWVQLTADQGEQPAATTATPGKRQRKGDELINSGRREEVLRYLGYEQGLWRYTSIPYDLSFSINLPGTRHQQLGFIFLALLPLLLLLGRGSRRRRIVQNSLVLILGILWLSSSMWSLTEAASGAALRQGMDTHRNEVLDGLAATGFTKFWAALQAPFVSVAAPLSSVFKRMSKLPTAVDVVLLILLVIAIALAVRPHFRKVKPALKYTALFGLTFSLQWFLLGNAIIWYGFPAFVLMLAIVGYFLQHGDELLGKGGQKPAAWILGTAFTVQLGLNLLFLFTTPLPNQSQEFIYNWPMIAQLSRGDLDTDGVQRYFNPTKQQITELINRNPSAKVFRVNTYTQYLIDKNDRRVLEDNQLVSYQKVVDRLRQESDFIQVLKANGFRYVLYDLNSASLDRTPDRSLTQKVNRFERLLTQDSRVQLLITDNFVQDAGAPAIRLPNGQTANARPALQGQTLYRGSLALFEIK